MEPQFSGSTSTRFKSSGCAIGVSPGWIHGHRATLTPSREMVIRGGQVVTVVDDKQIQTDDQRAFILNLAQMQLRLTIPEAASQKRPPKLSHFCAIGDTSPFLLPRVDEESQTKEFLI